MDPTIIVAVIAAAASMATAYMARAQRRDVALVRTQVQNSHTTNLREDIDRVLDGLERVHTGQSRHDAEIAGIRRDIRDERRERMALAERIAHIAS